MTTTPHASSTTRAVLTWMHAIVCSMTTGWTIIDAMARATGTYGLPYPATPYVVTYIGAGIFLGTLYLLVVDQATSGAGTSTRRMTTLSAVALAAFIVDVVVSSAVTWPNVVGAVVALVPSWRQAWLDRRPPIGFSQRRAG